MTQLAPLVSNETQFKKALKGDLRALIDLLVPTHVGWRLQGEFAISLSAIGIPAGITFNVPAINVIYHRVDNALGIYTDAGATGGPSAGYGASITTGPLIGWFSSDIDQVTDGLSVVVDGSAAEQFAEAASIQAHLVGNDERFGLAPGTFFFGGGGGCCYAGVGLGASHAWSLTDPIALPDFVRGGTGTLLESWWSE